MDWWRRQKQEVPKASLLDGGPFCTQWKQGDELTNVMMCTSESVTITTRAK